MTEARFLIDSNICIYVIGGADPRLRERFEDNAPGEVVSSSVVLAEVMLGLRNDPTIAARAATLFTRVPVLPFDDAAALAYAAVPFRRGTFDRLIAAHALSLDLTIVTSNTADFADVPGLRVENWTA